MDEKSSAPPPEPWRPPPGPHPPGDTFAQGPPPVPVTVTQYAPPPAYPGQPAQPGGYYTVQQGGQPPMMVQPGTATVIVQSAPPKPQNYLVLSIFVTLCCNVLFGLLAIMFSVMSDSDYNRGDVQSAQHKGKVALGLNIAGIIITVVLIVVIIIYYVVIVTSIFT